MPIDYEKRDGVAYITLNNPKKANILDKKTSDEISKVWIDLWEDREIRCAILTGAGDKHFCGGHNLAPRPDITLEERERLRDIYLEAWTELEPMERLREAYQLSQTLGALYHALSYYWIVQRIEPASLWQWEDVPPYYLRSFLQRVAQSEL